MSDMVAILAIAEHEVRTSHKAIVLKEKLSLVYNAVVCRQFLFQPRDKVGIAAKVRQDMELLPLLGCSRSGERSSATVHFETPWLVE
jgi:hypothetical protein